ncbi:MAG: type II secretion system F family protein, partial [Thermoplasmatota archaeon]
FLAQFLGFEVFRSLLGAFVASYPIVLGLALLVPAGVAVLRQRVATTEQYTDRRRAATVFLGLFTVIFAFFGAFIGSGLAQGTGIAIENAVIVMAGAVICVLSFAKTRLLLPTLSGLVKEQIEKSKHASADKDLEQHIQRSMVTTYVLALVFVLGFVAFFAATALHVVPAPQGSVGVEGAFFVYLLLGLGLISVLLVRYFQAANIDPKWKKKDDDEIGKKRLTAAEFQRYLVLGFSATFGTALFAIGVLIELGKITQLGPIGLAPKYSTDFWVFAILIGLGPYAWFYTREQNRIRAIDQKFPEFLRDLAESQRAGMTLTEAVLTAAKGKYGMLTPEIRKMAAQIEWGVSFTDAFERFGKRVKTPLIERTVALVVQAANAGGNVVDVLTAAADDAREIQQILKERKGSMSIYVMVIYVSFFVFMGVIGVLNAQFIPEVSKAVSKAAGVSIGGLHFTKIDDQAFKTLFFHAAIVQGFGGGLVAGVMEGGKPVSGLKHAFIMIAIAYVAFRFLIGS